MALVVWASGCGQSTKLQKKVVIAPAIGDICLVGKWTLQNDVSPTGYTVHNTPVPVSGLRGATITFQLDGTETRDFTGSEPLVGDYQGSQLVIKISGSVQFTIHASDGNFVESGTKTSLPTTATLGGDPIDYGSTYRPGYGQYQCIAGQLTFFSGAQTDTWSRG